MTYFISIFFLASFLLKQTLAHLSCLSTAPSGPPTTITAQNTSSSSIQVTWNLPIPMDRNGVITQFSLYYSRIPGQFNEATLPMSCSTPTVNGCQILLTRSGPGPYSINVQFLEKYIRYSFRVTAFTAVGEGAISSAVEAFTDEDVPAGAVQNLTAIPASSTSLVVTWYAPLAPQHSGIVLGYKLYVTR